MYQELVCNGLVVWEGRSPIIPEVGTHVQVMKPDGSPGRDYKVVSREIRYVPADKPYVEIVLDRVWVDGAAAQDALDASATGAPAPAATEATHRQLGKLIRFSVSQVLGSGTAVKDEIEETLYLSASENKWMAADEKGKYVGFGTTTMGAILDWMRVRFQVTP